MKTSYTFGTTLLTTLLAATTATSQELSEVLVTAEWRDTPLLSQSTSTSVLTSDGLRERAAQHLEEVLNVIPNLNYASGAARATSRSAALVSAVSFRNPSTRLWDC